MTRIRARPCAGKCFVDSKAPREVRDRPWPFFLHFPVLRPCPGQSQLGGEESPRLQPAPLESRGSGGVQRTRCPRRRTRAPGPVGGRRRTPDCGAGGPGTPRLSPQGARSQGRPFGVVPPWPRVAWPPLPARVRQRTWVFPGRAEAVGGQPPPASQGVC